MRISDLHIEIIKRCQKSPIFFLKNFGKTKHPSAGVIPLNPFHYQKKALDTFRKERFVIFRKTRQAGASKISGAYALWRALFFANKTILIVSRTDEDAMTFLRENIRFLFDHLPPWMRELWAPTKNNEHEMVFPNGSRIRSLTSHPDVLRSNASSLNIIDEAAFIENMGLMWQAGFPTLMHGGSCIVISTVSGVGTWYWNTWEDAKAGTNKFCPLTIEWWDMDWRIDFRDELTGEPRFISPTHEIRKCETPDEIVKYGPYWSPWLEEQWQGLQERGEDYKFRQEVLAEFAGSGNTILDQRVIAYIGTTVDNNYKITKGNQSYEHPVKVGESIIINFGNDDVSSIQKDIGLWVWREPIRPVRAVYEGGKLIKPAIPGHTYFGGVDLMTGRGGDYHALEMFDLDTMEQVAELMMRCLPRDFKYVIDFIGRWYNNAQLVVELNNGGVNTVDDLHMELMYPNLWRDIKFNDKPSNKSGVSVQYGNYGFNTGSSTKPRLNKSLLDHLRADDQGLKIYSSRLHKQLQIYVRKRDKQGRDTNKTEAESGPGNHDDLVMATGLALIGLPSALSYRADGLMPITVDNLSAVQEVSIDSIAGRMDQHVLAPLAGFGEPNIDDTIQRQLLNFANQLGALPLASEMHPVHDKPKYYSIQKSR